MRNSPPYPLQSVDNALRMLHVLRDRGSLRVSDAAEALNVGRSTAHRLLAMLVYRDFAVKDSSHTYRPGPALSGPGLRDRAWQELGAVVAPHMDALRERVGETVSFMVRAGVQTRFLATAVSGQVLHVGDRRGAVLPAWRTSGGKALLAELPEDELAALLRRHRGPQGEITATELRSLLVELRGVRARGYAENIDGTEPGVSAVGMCVHGHRGAAVGALSVAAPSVRYSRPRARLLAGALGATVTEVEHNLTLALLAAG